MAKAEVTTCKELTAIDVSQLISAPISLQRKGLNHVTLTTAQPSLIVAFWQRPGPVYLKNNRELVLVERVVLNFISTSSDLGDDAFVRIAVIAGDCSLRLAPGLRARSRVPDNHLLRDLYNATTAAGTTRCSLRLASEASEFGYELELDPSSCPKRPAGNDEEDYDEEDYALPRFKAKVASAKSHRSGHAPQEQAQAKNDEWTHE